MRWAIFGTGGMGREAADLAVQTYPNDDIVFVTDIGGPAVQGVQHILVTDLADEDRLILAIGDPILRKRLFTRLGNRSWGTLIAPSARISPSAHIGTGAIVCEGAIINNNARIGMHAIINVLSHVSHDSWIGDFATLSPRVSCNGWVDVGECAFVGAGAVISNGKPTHRRKIGNGSIVGAGAVVITDVPAYSTVKGVPAR